MAPLYVAEQGAVVHREGERVIIRKGGQSLRAVHVFKLDCLVVFGGVQVTTQAMGLLLANGVDVAFMSMNGRLKGRLMPTESRNVVLRLQQYERYHDLDFRLRFSKSLVQAKLLNARRLLERHMWNHPDTDLQEPLHALEDCIAAARDAPSLDVLRGVEGKGAAAYFQAFGRMVRGGLTFLSRTRRPPRDPVNALLSLGYSLITQELFGLVAARGFDPYLGFYHDVRYGRPALALDLVEEFRQAIVDRLTLTLVNRRVFSEEDFERQVDEEGVFLTNAGLRKFLAEYECRLRGESGKKGPAWRQVFQTQVDRLSRAVRLEEDYEPAQIED